MTILKGVVLLDSKKVRQIVAYLLIIILLIAGSVFLYNFLFNKAANDVTYYDVLQYFYEEKVTEYRLDLGKGTLEYTLNDADKTKNIYKVPNVNVFLEDTMDFVRAHNMDKNKTPIKVDYIPITETPAWISIIPTILLILVMVGFWIYMMRGAGGGGKIGGFAKAKVKHQPDGRKTTFEDVAGAQEEKEELQEIVEFLKNPQKYNDLGARIPKGVLLMGPPGTGKTLIARAVAGEAGVPFFSISGSDFVEMYVGVGASRVRDLFDQAKKEAPSIVFIDEIDAVGRHRGAGLGGGHDEREQTLNQLLVEMDGFGSNSGVIVIAATNRYDILDPALLRPGRFDRQIVVNTPDAKGREEILKVHTRNKPLGPDVKLSVIAKTTAGFTGADLENICNEAALLAARRNKKAITMAEIEEATIKVVAGPEKRSKVVTEKSKKITAYHEAGHAIVSYNCATQDPVHQVSIIPRGMAGGYTMNLPTEDKSYTLKTEMLEDIVVLLGGRCAEKLVLDDISTGASNDLERATKTAKAMITRYGFSEKLGSVVYGQPQGEVFLGRDFNQNRDFSETVAAEIDAEMRGLIDDAYEKAMQILKDNTDKLHELAKYLLACEKIDGEAFERFMKGELNVDEEIEKWNAEHEEENRLAEELAKKAEEAKKGKKSSAKTSEGEAEASGDDVKSDEQTENQADEPNKTEE